MYSNNTRVGSITRPASATHVSTINWVEIHDLVEVWIYILEQLLLLISLRARNYSLHRDKGRADLAHGLRSRQLPAAAQMTVHLKRWLLQV